MHALELRRDRYDGAAATALIDEVQAEYVVRYGSPDEAVVDPEEFAPPRGDFVVGYLDGAPIAMGGWRRLEPGEAGADGDAPLATAELKRMFVVSGHRGQGHARTILAHLESTARSAGMARIILITGIKQPEALELYRSTGYEAVTPFGHYAGYPDARFLGKVL